VNDKIVIRMLKNVKPDIFAFFEPENVNVIAKEGETYNAQSNRYGAISVIIDGKMLGVKPEEFEFLEAPSWILEKHGKLSEKYNNLVAESKKMRNYLNVIHVVCIHRNIEFRKCKNNTSEGICGYCIFGTKIVEKQTENKQLRSCETCQYFYDELYKEPCNSCDTMFGNYINK
jgi:hypothetical protein